MISKPIKVPVTNPKVGQQVVYCRRQYKIEDIYNFSSISTKPNYLIKLRGTEETSGISELSTISVEVKDYPVCKGQDEIKKTIPLQESDWEYVIQNNFADVEVHICHDLSKYNDGMRERAMCAEIIKPILEGIQIAVPDTIYVPVPTDAQIRHTIYHEWRKENDTYQSFWNRINGTVKPVEKTYSLADMEAAWECAREPTTYTFKQWLLNYNQK